MKADVLEETVVLLFGPNTSIDVGFVAASLSGHDWGDGDGDGDGEVELSEEVNGDIYRDVGSGWWW